MNIPNVITNKDIVYLKDLFYKNYFLCKNLDMFDKINDAEINDIITRIRNMHEDHMFFIISSLKKENCFIGEDDE